MAYLEIPMLKNSINCLARVGQFIIPTAATGPGPDVYMISGYCEDITISSLGSSAAVFDVQAATDPPEIIAAGGGIWVGIPGMTGNTNVAKLVSFSSPLTAIRINVTSGVAGNATLNIRTGAQT